MRTLRCLLYATWGYWLVGFAAGTAQGQTVVKSVTEKGWVIAKFEDTAAISKGQHACFLDETGTTVACGKVAKVNRRFIVVKVTPISAAAQVKPGFSTEISASQPKTAKTKKSRARAGGTAVRLVTSPGLGVFSIAKVGYVAPAVNASGVELWTATDKKINIEKISLGIEFDLAEYASTVGIKYALYGDASPQFVSKLVLQTDYDLANRNKFVEAAHSATAVGAYYDYAFMQPARRRSGLRLVAGAEYMNTVGKLIATLNDESDGSKSNLATVQSTLGVLSLRSGVDYQLRVGKYFEAGVGLRGLIPVAGVAATQKVALDDENITKSDNEEDDLKKALEHKKSSFALTIPIYVSFVF